MVGAVADIKADIVLVGAGPTGLPAAWRLATGGADVLCIEQGDVFSPPDLRPGEPGFARLKAGPLHPDPKVRREPYDYLIDDGESDIAPILGNAVGGGSNYWSAHVPRFRPQDFRVRTTHGVANDWPLSEADLRPYYQLYDEMVGTAFQPGEPSMPPRAAPTRALPPLYPAAQRLADGFNALNWSWWPVDLVRGRQPEPVVACSHAGPCDIGCPSWRAATASTAFLDDAVRAGLRLMTRTRAVRITHDHTGRITGLLCHQGSGELVIKARTVVLAGNAIATPWLMLASRSDRFPNGIGNDHDQVGRHLMLHPYGWARGYVDGMPPRTAEAAAGIVCTQFQHDAGTGTQCGLRLQSAQEPSQRALDAAGQDGGGWIATSICVEDLPEASNRVSLSPTVMLAGGLPAPKLSYRVSENSHHLLHFGVERAAEALGAAGAGRIELTPLVRNAGFHIMGTARMGHAPETSVIDADACCHGVAGLVIADCSAFVTGGAMNPTATASALALRAADGLLGQSHTLV